MGYKYHLQLDDDTMVNGNISFNFATKMNSEQLKMAVTYQIWQDSPSMLAGLAEITRYWIYINSFDPPGTLYEHLNPKSINGLTTETWDRKYHPGYFTILDLEFWFDPTVQDFLQTILKVNFIFIFNLFVSD
jgi:hypothetical protein